MTHTAVKSGIFSRAICEPLEAEYRKELADLLAEVLGPAYHPNGDAPMLRELAKAYVRRDLLERYYGSEDGDEEMPKQRYDMYRAADNKIAKLLGLFGLSPSDRARLGVNLAQAHSIAAKVAQQQAGVAGTAQRKPVNQRPRCACGEPATKRRKATGEVLCDACAEVIRGQA